MSLGAPMTLEETRAVMETHWALRALTTVIA
jgi:hypothetical protein